MNPTWIALGIVTVIGAPLLGAIVQWHLRGRRGPDR